MPSLAQLSQKRLSGQLPTFDGVTLVERLVNGRAAAAAALRHYVPDYHFDEADAHAVMHEINTWSERNHAALAIALDPATNPSNALPEALKLLLGAHKTQQFILASFTQAALGLGPWQAGEVARYATEDTVLKGTLVDRSWAEADAEMRLQTFGLIVRMDQDGTLQAIFRPEAVSGVGALATSTIVLIAIVTAVLAAAIVIFLVWDRSLERNNVLMREMCLRAQAEGKDDIVAECVRATADLQLTLFPAGLGKKIGQALLLFGGGYLVVRFVLPKIIERQREART